MPRMRDIPPALGAVGPFRFLKRLWTQIARDNVFTLAAAMAYSWMFAVFPFVIFLMTLIPYLPERTRDRAREDITVYVYTWLPKQAADAIFLNLPDVLDQKRGALLILGIVITLWAASGGMAMTMHALDRCYNVDESRPMYVARPLAMALTVAVASMVLATLLLLPIGSIAIEWLKRQPDTFHIMEAIIWPLNFTRWFLAVLLLLATLSTIYFFGPSIRQRYRFITPGSAFCLIAWIGLGLLFRGYIERFGQYDKTYGALGGVVVLLTIFYLNAVVLLIGAEINSEIDFIVLKVKPGTREFRYPSPQADAVAAPDA